VTVEAVASHEELYDVAFTLLGNSTEDLFFPANYLLVEGASDQAILERVLQLMAVPHGRIKVFATGGVDPMKDTLFALERALLPMVARDLPYAKRVVALIDLPTDPGSQRVVELERVLGQRLVQLDETSIEEAIPPAVYERANLEKDSVLEELRALKGDLQALRDAKRSVSRRLAAALTADDLDGLGRLTDAVQKAMDTEPDVPEGDAA
jgi:hypothetical protein